MAEELLKIGPHVTALPVVHGSGDFAWEVRRIMSSGNFDCVAVPLPSSFQQLTEQAIVSFPNPGIVVQRDFQALDAQWDERDWSQSDSDDSDEFEPQLGASYVPIDPCQPVIAALRSAMGERLPRHFIDLETFQFEVISRPLPDAYALKQVPIYQFASAVVPHLEKPPSEQWARRISHMAWRLRELSVNYQRILFVVSVLDWPWIREAFLATDLTAPEQETVNECEQYQVDKETLYFLLGEIPFITNLYEQARASLEDDAELSIDGVKELLMNARTAYRKEFGNRARQITPRTLATCLKYIRNLSLIDHRFFPTADVDRHGGKTDRRRRLCTVRFR